MQLRKDTSQEKRSPDMSHSKHSFDHFVRCVAVLVLAVGTSSVGASSVGAGGQSLPAPVKISNGVLPGKSFAAMAVDAKGGIDIAWTQSDGSVTFRRSTDGGVTFSNPTVVQPAISPTPILVAIQVGADEAGNINLVWTQFGVGPDADLFSRSTDGGLTFSTPRDLAPSFGAPVGGIPRLTVDSTGDIQVGDVTVQTVNNAIIAPLVFIHSSDGGATFSAPVTIWTPASPQNTLGSLWTGDGPEGQVYVFWTSESNGNAQCDILFSRSLDSGGTFSSPANISNAPGSCSAGAIAAVDPAGRVSVVWVSNSASITFSRSVDQGASFSVPTSVSGILQGANVGIQQLGVNARGEVAVAWESDALSTGVTDILFARSKDGSHFPTPTILNLPPVPTNGNEVGPPAVGIDRDGEVSVAWSDNGVGDIFFKRSKAEGSVFSNPAKLSNIGVTEAQENVSQLIENSQGDAYVLWKAVVPFDFYFNRVPASASLPGDFRIRVTPKSETAAPGATLQLQVAGVALGANTDVVTLSCSSLPRLATCTFNPPSITVPSSAATSMLTLTIPATTAPGNYLFAVNGVGGSTIDTKTVALTVTAPGQ
jgi:hypothetical protein